jgi:prenyltransferase beta subunit
MKTKHFFITVVVATLLISLILSTVIVYAMTDMLAETRKSALIRALSDRQLKDLGAFHNRNHDLIIGGYWPEQYYANERTTADALLTLKILNASNHVNVTQAIDYIACKQYQRDTGFGGFGALFGEDGTFLGCNLYDTYWTIRVLKLYNSLDKINQTSLVDFTLKRYNDSIGAFHELVTEANDKQYAYGGFPLVFRSFQSHIAYAVPNILTTYAGICTLKELDRLDLINTTRVFEWVMHCRAENSMSKPYPDTKYLPLPEWSPLKSNPFEVDRYGTGIPYTFAAVSILEALKRLDAISVEDKHKIEDYIVACQGNITGLISIHQDYYYPEASDTYWAVMIMHYFRMLNEKRDVVTKIENYFLKCQMLRVYNSWLIPNLGDSWDADTSENYGLYNIDEGPFSDSYYAVAVFNATGHLNLLDQPTPQVLKTWFNLTVFSALATALTTVTLIVVLKIQKWRLAKRIQTAPPAEAK